MLNIVQPKTLPLYQKLKSKKTFGELRSYKSIDHTLFYMKTIPSAELTLGIIASKRIGNAVMRNFVKRRLRHAFMLAVKERHAEISVRTVLLIAKKPILDCVFDDLVQAVTKALVGAKK